MMGDLETPYLAAGDTGTKAPKFKTVTGIIAICMAGLGLVALPGVRNFSADVTRLSGKAPHKGGLYFEPPEKVIQGLVTINKPRHPKHGQRAQVIPGNFIGFIQMYKHSKQEILQRIKAEVLGHWCVQHPDTEGLLGCFQRDELTQDVPVKEDRVNVETMYKKCASVGFDEVYNTFVGLGNSKNAHQFIRRLVNDISPAAEDYVINATNMVGTCNWGIRGCMDGNSTCKTVVLAGGVKSRACVCKAGWSSQDGKTCVDVHGQDDIRGWAKDADGQEPKMKMGKKPMFQFKPNIVGTDGSWYDDFIGDQNFAVLSPMRIYRPRTAKWVHRPTRWGPVQTVSAGHEHPIVGAIEDLDDPVWLALETTWTITGKTLLPGLHRLIYDAVEPFAVGCKLGITKSLSLNEDGTFDDSLEMKNDTLNDNSWNALLSPISKFKQKKDWVYGFYKGEHMIGGLSSWPEMKIDWAKHFRKTDEWEDRTEKALAFHHIGAHRLEVVAVDEAQKKCPWSGVGDLPYVVKLNKFATFAVRPKFGKYGSDLYFDQDGMPRAVITTDGACVVKGDKDWQYWKFVWRSSFVNIITVVDHLHMAHFRAAGVLARVTRETLPPDHALRRLMTIFTYGSPLVNQMALHILSEPNAGLHRASPWTKEAFVQVNAAAPTLLEAPEDRHKVFSDEAEWEKMPEIFQKTPYYGDGKLVFNEIRALVSGYTNDVLWESFDGSQTDDAKITDPYIKDFAEKLIIYSKETGYKTAEASWMTNKTFQESLVAYIWTVTGWHRHVGQVSDYVADPDIVSISWVEGELAARPKQVLLAGSIDVFTGMPQPKLIEDYTHVFQHSCRRISEALSFLWKTSCVKKKEQAQAHWRAFQKNLIVVNNTVAARNEERAQKGDITNDNGSPSQIELSVAV